MLDNETLVDNLRTIGSVLCLLGMGAAIVGLGSSTLEYVLHYQLPFDLVNLAVFVVNMLVYAFVIDITIRFLEAGKNERAPEQ